MQDASNAGMFRPVVVERFEIDKLAMSITGYMRGAYVALLYDTTRLRWRHRHHFRVAWKRAAAKRWGLAL